MKTGYRYNSVISFTRYASAYQQANFGLGGTVLGNIDDAIGGLGRRAAVGLKRQGRNMVRDGIASDSIRGNINQMAQNAGRYVQNNAATVRNGLALGLGAGGAVGGGIALANKQRQP